LPEPQPAQPPRGFPAQPRLTPLEPAQRTQEQRELLVGAWGADVPNLFSTVARQPRSLPRLDALLHTALDAVGVPAPGTGAADHQDCLTVRKRLRAGAPSQVWPRGGLSDRDLAALTGGGSHDWTPRERLLVAAADELHANHEITKSPGVA